MMGTSDLHMNRVNGFKMDCCWHLSLCGIRSRGDFVCLLFYPKERDSPFWGQRPFIYKYSRPLTSFELIWSKPANLPVHLDI